MFGVPWPAHRLWGQKIRNEARMGSGRDRRTGRGSTGNLTNTAFSLLRQAPSEQTACCHKAARGYLPHPGTARSDEGGWGCSGRLPGGGGKRLMDQPQHARPWPRKT